MLILSVSLSDKFTCHNDMLFRLAP